MAGHGAHVQITTPDDEIDVIAARLAVEWGVPVQLVREMLVLEKAILTLHHRLVLVER